MKKQFLTLFLLLLPISGFSQGLNVYPRYLVNMPIASTLPRASFDVSMYSFAHGGLLAGLEVGMTERFMFGVTFGGINVIGENEVDWHPLQELLHDFSWFAKRILCRPFHLDLTPRAMVAIWLTTNGLKENLPDSSLSSVKSMKCSII